MKSRQIKRIAAILALSAAFSAVWAQDKPDAPAAPDAKQDAKQDAKPDAKAPEKADAKADEQEPIIEGPQNNVTFGLYGWAIGRNSQRLHQYATPSGGLSIDELSLFSFAEGQKPYLNFIFRGNPDADFALQTMAIFNEGKGYFKGGINKFSYEDPTVIPTPASIDDVSTAELSYALTPDLGLFATFKSRAANHWFEAPFPHFDTLTNTYSIGAEGKVLQGQAGVAFVGTTFNDHNNVQPDWTRNQYQAHYGRDITTKLAAEGTYSRTNILQSGLDTAKIDVYALDADFDVSPTSSLFLNVRREDFDLPNVQNAVLQKRLDTTLRLQGVNSKQRYELGFRHREEQLLNADHSNVDVPAWNKLNARLSGALNDLVHYSFNANWERFNKGGVIDSSDAFGFYWDDKLFAQARLDGGKNKLSWYAAETYRMKKNVTNEVQIRSYDSLFGGTYSCSPKTTAFFEFTYEDAIAQGATDPTGVSLSDFFPTTATIALGLDHQLPNNATFNINLNHNLTTYVNPLLLPDGNIGSTQITMQYKKQLNKVSSMSLLFAPLNYTDKVYSQYGYSAKVFGVTYSNKF